ncbi:MAG: SRPBCC family protein [Anaerolineae bacterium]|nr:SRPBCC family protein [Anaerolineae bacterium]
MINVKDSIVIHRPVEEVFAYVSDLTNAPEWQTGLIEVRKTTAAPLGIGTQFTFVRKFLGRKLEASNEFTVYKPDEIVTFKTTSGPISVEASYLFETEPEGTRVTCHIEMKPEGFSKLAEPLIAASVRREMSAEFGYLKDLLENRAVEILSK